MPQNPRQGLGIHTAGQGMGGEGMPQVVKANRGEFCVVQESFHPAVHRGRGHRFLRFHRVVENPRAVGGFLTLAQQVCGTGRQENASLSCVGFGFSDLGAAALADGDGASDKALQHMENQFCAKHPKPLA